MSSYEDSSLTEIEAVLDGLDEATSVEVYDATRGYSPKALAAVAASRADAAGGGGGGADFPDAWTVEDATGQLTMTFTDDVQPITIFQGAGATVAGIEVKDGDGDTYFRVGPTSANIGGTDACPPLMQVSASLAQFWGDPNNDSVAVIKYGPGSELGFYGATPTAKPTGVTVDAAGIHAALVTLGLIEG